MSDLHSLLVFVLAVSCLYTLIIFIIVNYLFGGDRYYEDELKCFNQTLSVVMFNITIVLLLIWLFV